jgi:cobalamin biosynthesis protein CbiG
MSPAIIAVSRQGTRTAQLVLTGFSDAVVHAPARFAGTAPARKVKPYKGKPALVIAREFERGTPLILVMAVGAAVRLVAPLLRDKLSDPAVVVVDDGGRYAISLVSGHAGGANDLARQVAQLLGAEAVVTTASEGAGLPSIEQIARSQGWWVEPASNMTRLTASLINGEPAGVYQDAGEDEWCEEFPAGCLTRYPTIEALCEAPLSAHLVVTDRLVDLPERIAKQAVICRPAVLVLGVGCSTGATPAELAHLVDETLARAELSSLAVFALATIDRRRSDSTIVSFVRERRLQLIAFSAEELETTAGVWTRSATVRRAVGAGGVAEPAALRCAGARSLLVRKAASKHVTVAVARAQIADQATGSTAG